MVNGMVLMVFMICLLVFCDKIKISFPIGNENQEKESCLTAKEHRTKRKGERVRMQLFLFSAMGCSQIAF